MLTLKESFSTNNQKNILVISNARFEVFGGYEKVLLTILPQLQKKYNVTLLSTPFYKSSNKPLEEFKKYELSIVSDYKNKFDFILKISLQKLINQRFFINWKAIYTYLHKCFLKPHLILVTDPLLIGSIAKALHQLELKSILGYWDHGALFRYLQSRGGRFIFLSEIKKAM